MGEPVFFWGWHAGHRQPTAVPVAQIVQKSARVRKEQRKNATPLEASRALKRISAHIQMADGARVPGVRMVADGAWVRGGHCH